MTVAIDQNGYFYDTDTGYLINVGYDENGNAIDLDTGAVIDHVITDSIGTTIYTGGKNTDWNAIIDTAAQAYAANQGAAQTGHYIPQQTQSPRGYQTLGNRAPGGISLGGGINPGGAGGNLNISTNTLILIGLGAALFFIGTQRGGGRR